MKLPSDFGNEISKALNWKLEQVAEWFTLGEDKEGFFWARLKPKKILDTPEFKTMCALVRDLRGEDYVKGDKAWKVPGPYVKKGDTTSTAEPAGDARSRLPERPKQEIAPRSVADDKSRPPQFMVPVKALLSMPFQCRTSPDDPEMAELTESIRALGVLQPILVRPKPNGLYEIVYGQRRARAAEKAGLVEVPVTIRFLSDEEAFTLQLTENLQRKDLSEEEKSRALGELARRTGWNAQQIADKLKMSYTWVIKYLPDKFKAEEKAEAGKAGGEARAEAYRESQDFATRRVAESQDIIQAGEARRAAQPEQLHEPIGAPAEHHLEPERQVTEGPKPLLTGFEVECPECHVKLLINHVDHPNGKVSHQVEE